MSWLDDISSSVSEFFGIESDWGRAAVGLGTRLVTVSAVSSLIGNRAQQNQPDYSPPAGVTDKLTGNQITLDANTNNKIGVVYGEAFVGSAMIDAKISTDQKTTWFVYAISEATDTGTYTMGDIDNPTTTNILWGDKQCIFGDGGDRTKVTKWINGNGDEDTSVNGYMFVYLFPNGVNSGTNTSGLSAVDILSVSSIDATERWDSAKYNTDGAPTMENTAFAIVKLVYNQDAHVTNTEQFRILLTNTLNKPGDVILDYMTNERYGCAIPLSQVDTDSLTALNDYSDELISYTPVGGGTAYQPRYRINGSVDTGQTCLVNLQQMVDSCDSWLQWNSILSQWSVVINQSYLDYTTYNDLFVVSSDNLTSGVNITPTDLNSTYNVIETHFTNYKIKDARDFNYVYLDSADMNPNELPNKLIVELQLINDSVQAKYLATRRLIQCREDLVINFELDYSGIQINAGDVIRVRHEAYGWGPTNEDPVALDKLFRVDQVQEEKSSDGNLGVRITAFEYNEQVYENIDITDYNPAANTGLTDPSIVAQPGSPTITNVNQEAGTFTVEMTIPTPGQIVAVEFWYGPTATIVSNNYKLWDTQYNGSTPVYTAGTIESTNVVGLEAGTYYWKVRAVTQTTKSQFSNSTAQTWTPAQLPTRTSVSEIESNAVSYTNTYGLWTDSTRGQVLNIDYTPSADGSDVSPSTPNNQIEVQFQAANYTAGATAGLLLELWVAIRQWPSMYNITKGTNGFVIAGGDSIYYTKVINDTYPTASTVTDYELSLSTPSAGYIAAASNGSRYVVGGNGTMIYSDYGYKSWTACTVPAGLTGKQITDIIYESGLGIWVAVGGTTGSYIMSSSDGITWTERDNGTVSGLASVTWNGSQFLALGAQFSRATSSDGITWTLGYVSGGSAIAINSVTYSSSASTWFACGHIVIGSQTYGRVYKYDVGTSLWNAVLSNIYPSTSYTSIATGAYGGYDYTFAVGLYGEAQFSYDQGATWAQDSYITTSLGSTSTYWMVKIINNVFYFLGTDSNSQMVAYDIVAVEEALVKLALTSRLQAFGSDPTTYGEYNTTLQPVQDQLVNNTLTNYTFRTGFYLKDVPLRYFLVAGDLQNPTTPSTVYSGRRQIALTEYKG